MGPGSQSTFAETNRLNLYKDVRSHFSTRFNQRIFAAHFFLEAINHAAAAAAIAPTLARLRRLAKALL